MIVPGKDLSTAAWMVLYGDLNEPFHKSFPSGETYLVIWGKTRQESKNKVKLKMVLVIIPQGIHNH
jgi:hypothetical protein